jgi:DNA-binding CsgD family transcriptional regulator
MHRTFQTFVDTIAESSGLDEIQRSMSAMAEALHLHSYAYLSIPDQPGAAPQHITTYPPTWTAHYLRSRYQALDPIVSRALSDTEPFEWGGDQRCSIELSEAQRRLFDEAAKFGIRYGFTIPIHDGRGPTAAMTFASDESRLSAFQRCIGENRRVLQLLAIYFHAHVRRKLIPDRLVDGVALTPREFECLDWSAQGKTTWEIGRILGISRHTVATHLENVKEKLGVRTVVQAVSRLASAKSQGYVRRPVSSTPVAEGADSVRPFAEPPNTYCSRRQT